MARPKGQVTLKRERRNLESNAYHEAGHAVMAVVLGRKFRRVHIHRDETIDRNRPETVDMISLGGLDFSPLPKSIQLFAAKDRLHAENEIMIALAGALAQGRFLGRHSWNRLSPTDRKPIEELSLVHSGGLMTPPTPRGMARFQDNIKNCNDRYRDWLACRAKVVLDGHWAIVEAVAAALLERRELTGREVEKIAHEVTGSARLS